MAKLYRQFFKNELVNKNIDTDVPMSCVLKFANRNVRALCDSGSFFSLLQKRIYESLNKTKSVIKIKSEENLYMRYAELKYITE